jgi:gamma-glutamyl:cysteine ligase YbdK (ATP-grasp superfamily)
MRLATERGNKVSNRIILEMPKLEEGTEKLKGKLIKSCAKHHGTCDESRDEGIRRSFSKVLKGDKRRYELTIKCVGNLTNREWQGDKFKQDPCYLKLTKDVLGKKASTATLGISVGIANATRGLEHRNLAE